MRIAIDARTICDAGGGPGAGIEHYTQAVLTHLVRRHPRDAFLVFVPPSLTMEGHRALAEGRANVRVLTLPARPPIVGRQILMPLIALAWRADVLFCPTPHLPALWPRPSVIAVHDLSIFRHPEWFPAQDAAGLSTRRLVPRALRRATRIVAVSDFAARQAGDMVPGAFAKVDVVPPGVRVPAEVSGTDRFEIPGEFVLCLGTVEPRKNVEAAIAAFGRFLADHPERAYKLRLVLAGKWGWKTEGPEAAMREANKRWRMEAPDGVVRATGPVTEEEKWELLSRAAALMMSSWEEGFGLPALEAMALGVPVIASDRGALPDVVGDAGFLCAPEDVEEMALLLAQVLLMPEAVVSVAEAGAARAAAFTWEATADGVMEALRKAIR